MSESKIKILLIEDDPFLLSMYSAKFEMEDFLISCAEDGEKGLALAKNDKPDIILLDIMLPGIDGFEVLQKLKAESSTASIPVIMLTNLNQKDEYERGMKLGAVDFLIKAHYLPSEVVKKIKDIVKANVK